MPVASLKKTIEFKRVSNKGKKYYGRYFTIILSDGSGISKLGVVVSGKFGAAVSRNRTKRQIKEAYRSIANELRRITDIVAIPKAAASKVKTAELTADLRDILSKAKII